MSEEWQSIVPVQMWAQPQQQPQAVNTRVSRTSRINQALQQRSRSRSRNRTQEPSVYYNPSSQQEQPTQYVQQPAVQPQFASQCSRSFIVAIEEANRVLTLWFQNRLDDVDVRLEEALNDLNEFYYQQPTCIDERSLTTRARQLLYNIRAGQLDPDNPDLHTYIQQFNNWLAQNPQFSATEYRLTEPKTGTSQRTGNALSLLSPTILTSTIASLFSFLT